MILMKDSRIYKRILDNHVHNMVRDMLTTRNACSVMQGAIIKELSIVKGNISSKYGEGCAQNAAFVLTLDTFSTTELAKFCLILSMKNISNASQALDSIGATEEALLFDGAEQMAQFLLEGFNKDSREYLAKTLNTKSDLFAEIKTFMTKTQES